MKANTTGGWGAARRGDWLMGCGIALAVVVLLIAGTVVFVAMNWRGWAASGMDTAFTKMIAEMPLEDEQRVSPGAVDRSLSRQSWGAQPVVNLAFQEGPAQGREEVAAQ